MKYLYFTAIMISLLSCEKDINFDLNETTPSLVVDAQIENGHAPIVILTNSIPYFGKIDTAVLKKLFVHDADVSISDGSVNYKLIEFTRTINDIAFSVYTIDTSILKGKLNCTYSLKIITNGKEYTSSTTIPNLNVKVDTFYFESAPANTDTNTRIMKVKLTDPKGIGNYIRYWSKRNTNPLFPGRKSVFTDEIIDGTTFTIQLEPGIDRNDPPKTGENFFMKSDTVFIKMASIDKPTYTFWNTWEFAAQSVGNPFSQPNKVLGNISNGALGAFCGYAAWYSDTVIIK